MTKLIQLILVGEAQAPALFFLRRCPLHESLAALHLVGQRRLVDLDHDRIGVDAEVLHQRLRDVAHHAGLLLIGAAGGHAHGNFRHCCLSLCSCYDPYPLPRAFLLHAMKGRRCILHRRHHPRKRMIQYSAPFSVQFGVTTYWMPAFAGMTALAISTSLRAYQESCVLPRPMQPAAPWSGPLPASADIRRDLFRVLPVRR